MKKIIFLFLLLTSSIVLSQNIEISILENLKKELSEEIIVLNDSIKKIELQINAIKSKEIQQMISDSTLRATVRKGAKLRNVALPAGELIAVLAEDKDVVILDYNNGYFGVCYDTVCGYMHALWVKKDAQINEFIKTKEAEEIMITQLLEEQKLKKQIAEWAELEKKYKKKYGVKTYNELKNGYYWIGMNKEMATISLGSPNDINRTVGSWGVHEQWVYDEINLYFENGKLTSYQN